MDSLKHAHQTDDGVGRKSRSAVFYEQPSRLPRRGAL